MNGTGKRASPLLVTSAVTVAVTVKVAANILRQHAFSSCHQCHQ